MSSSLPINIASTIQSASLNRSPSPNHDLNPSTAASAKQPVTISPGSRSSTSQHASAIRPVPRHSTLPPLPDLRFEQSYLASLHGSSDWKVITYITVRDQVLLPLFQGTLWTLALSGWRFWNRGAQFAGEGLGSRVRRWWWRVNGWEIPIGKGKKEKAFAQSVGEVSFIYGEYKARS